MDPSSSELVSASTNSDQVTSTLDQVKSYFEAFEFTVQPAAVLDILIVALVFYWLYLLLRQTRAISILYGIAILVGIWIIGQLFNLTTVNYLLKLSSVAFVVAIPVVFQPELRAGLEKLGRTQFVADFVKLRKSDVNEIAKKITSAVEVLAHDKLGAIIVIGRRTGLREYIETGVRLDAQISPELIISIFSGESALHDGAIIIQGTSLAAAKVILPLSDSKFDFRLGTRHRAAVGITSQTDAIAIIVSQERGEISLAVDGLLETKISPQDLEKILVSQLKPISNKKK